MPTRQTKPRKGLARNLALSFSIFVLLTSLAIVAWMTWWFEREDLKEFEELAVTNVNFTTELRLPKSRELAERLTSILGCGVGFRFSNGQGGGWPSELEDSVTDLTESGDSASSHSAGYAVAVAPYADQKGTFLVLFRKQDGVFPGTKGIILAPAILFTIACALLGIFVGRRIVRPLSTLSDWLPNLDVEPDKDTPPVPEKISKRSDEIGALALALQQTAQDLQREQKLRQESERLATLGRIATSLAHEIKNPVAAIGLHADIVAGQVNGAELESVQMIREEVDRITDLVNQWLFVARPNPARTSHHNLYSLVKAVAKRLNPVLEHARSKLTIKPIPKQSPIIEADGPRIEQVIRNLILNASQAMPEGGEISVEIEATADSATLTIGDDGPGFSEQALSRFGEPFYSEKEGGMGIGLTLAKEVIQSHGGKLTPKNPEEGGASIRCTLPLAPQSQSE